MGSGLLCCEQGRKSQTGEESRMGRTPAEGGADDEASCRFKKDPPRRVVFLEPGKVGGDDGKELFAGEFGGGVCKDHYPSFEAGADEEHVSMLPDAGLRHDDKVFHLVAVRGEKVGHQRTEV